MGTRMNADERRPGIVARCAKVDRACLEAVLRAGARKFGDVPPVHLIFKAQEPGNG